MFRQLLRPVTRTVRQQGRRSYHEPAVDYKYPSMNELPVPQGSWQENYNAKQKTYNMQLAAGVIYAAATLTYIISTGAIYFNWAPPKPKDQK